MAEFDWMRDPAFLEECVTQVGYAVAKAQLPYFQRQQIVAWLGQRLAERRTLRESEELIKAAYARKGRADAIASVQRLAALACEVAAREKRQTLTQEDIQAAFTANYCTFWPWC